MSPLEVLEIGRTALWVLIKISLPIMIVALVVGLIISLFQALTQIQEQTLSFVPKIIAVFFAMIIFLPFMGQEMKAFSDILAERIAGL